jgi:hypothetical protein
MFSAAQAHAREYGRVPVESKNREESDMLTSEPTQHHSLPNP